MSLGHHQHMFFQSFSRDIAHCAYFGMFTGMAIRSRDAITVFAAVATRPRADGSIMEDRRCKSLITFSLGHRQHLTHCWHHGTRHPGKVSQSAIRHAPSNMATIPRTQTHTFTHTHPLTQTHTIKSPTAGV